VTVQQAIFLGSLAQYLNLNGLRVFEVSDPFELQSIIERWEKPYITPMSSPGHNDFTPQNVIWLVAEKEDKPVMFGCARLEDLERMSIDTYWRQVFNRAYSGDTGGKVIDQVSVEIVENLKGRLVYFGDLFVSPNLQRSVSLVRAFVAIGHLAVALKWNPDWTYCFLRERDIMRGASNVYGFNRVFGRPFKWVCEPPPPRKRSEWLAALSRADLPNICAETVRHVDELLNASSDK